MSREVAASPPWAEIEMVFLDAGNTLVSVDFAWVAGELGSRGYPWQEEALRRAEAAARPAVSARVAERRQTEGDGAFRGYLRLVLEHVPEARRLAADELEALVDALVPVLRIPGRADLLWSALMPGVPEALAAMREAGLRLAVVSNADGTVERSLVRLGLRDHFDVVVDSHVVGFEKPDPRIFSHALEAAGADPARTLHVGDLYAADVVGARAAGVHAVLLDPYDDWHPVDCERLPDLAAVARALREVRR